VIRLLVSATHPFRKRRTEALRRSGFRFGIGRSSRYRH
jgi:hypothetical protein